MNQELIPHVFASLQTLERYVEQVRTLSAGGAESNSEARALLPEFDRVVKQMRRTANKLQFHVAAADEAATVRTLRIFYGLNHMVRPEVLKSLVGLTKGTPPQLELAVAAAQEVH